MVIELPGLRCKGAGLRHLLPLLPVQVADLPHCPEAALLQSEPGLQRALRVLAVKLPGKLRAAEAELPAGLRRLLPEAALAEVLLPGELPAREVGRVERAELLDAEPAGAELQLPRAEPELPELTGRRLLALPLLLVRRHINVARKLRLQIAHCFLAGAPEYVALYAGARNAGGASTRSTGAAELGGNARRYLLLESLRGLLRNVAGYRVKVRIRPEETAAGGRAERLRRLRVDTLLH